MYSIIQRRTIVLLCMAVAAVTMLVLETVSYHNMDNKNILDSLLNRGGLDQSPEMRPVSSAFETFVMACTQSTNHRKENAKYIVFGCSKGRPGICGGWSDRIVGIVTTFLISILTKRHFLINVDNPCFLPEFVTPAHYDWLYNSSIRSNRTYSFYELRNTESENLISYLQGQKDFYNIFQRRYVFLRMNWDRTTEIMKRPNIGKDVPWLAQYNQSDIYKYLFHFLFKLSPLSARELSRQYETQRNRNKIACVHIRIGQNSNMPKDGTRLYQSPNTIWTYFDTLSKDEYDLFVATDSNAVRAIAKKRYPKHIIDTEGKITHIDQPHKNDPHEGFLKQLIDFYILVSCDKLIISSSGFSMLAAMVRNKTSGLYCWRGEYVIPCSRYTIKDIFPELPTRRISKFY